MGGSVSVIITVRNEERHIGALLESLVGQSSLREVIVVDSQSDDATVEILAGFQDRLPLQVHVEACTRGRGRNIGAGIASGTLLAFIDGDCIAQPGWLQALADADDGKTVLAGHTQYSGKYGASRVPIFQNGQDVTWPSCNLAYPRALFERIGGYDDDFHTAEDVDLNLRAVNAGASIHHIPNARVAATTRDSLGAFLRQAYSYGQGRRQLEAKHPYLAKPDIVKALRSHASPRGILRLASGWLGHRRGIRP